MYFQRLNGDGLKFSRQLSAFDLTLDFLLKNNKAEILANSQVVTLNGHKATISMVDIVPYILSSGGLGVQVQVQREEIGIKLEILPTVNTDGYITTSVTPEGIHITMRGLAIRLSFILRINPKIIASVIL